MSIEGFLSFIQQEKDEEKEEKSVESVSGFLDFLKKDRDKSKKIAPGTPEDFLKFLKTDLKVEQTRKLANAQKKVKWIHELKEPKRAEFMHNLEESMKERYGFGIQDLYTEQYWRKGGQKLIGDALQMWYDVAIGFQDRWAKRGEEAIMKYSKYLDPGSRFALRAGIPKERREEIIKAIEEGTIEDPIRGGLSEAGKTILEPFAMIPRTYMHLLDNPFKTLQDEPVEVMALMAAAVGGSAAKGILKKFKTKIAKKQPVSLKMFVDPLIEASKQGKLHPELAHKMMKIPLTEIEIPTAAWEIVKHPSKRGGATIFRHQVVGLAKDIARVGDIKSNLVTWAKGKVTIPLRRMERFPWARRLFYDKARSGGYTALRENIKLNDKLKIWNNMGIKGRKMWQDVGKALAYLSEDGKQLMANMGIEMPELTPLQWKAVSWIRSVYDKLLVQINKARTANGLKPINPRKNYFTFIRSLKGLQEAGIDLHSAPVSTINEALATGFRFAKGRKYNPKLFNVPIALDADMVLKHYAQQAHNHIHLADAIGTARAFLKPFKHPGQKTPWFNLQEAAPAFHAELSQWADMVAGVADAIPKIGGGARAYKILRGIQRNIAVGVLGWNVRSALIQPTALRLSYVMLGEHNLVNGVWKNFTSPKWRKFALRNSEVLMSRIKGYSMDVHMQMAAEGGIGSKFWRGRQAFLEASMKPLQVLDFETARATWIGAYRLAEKMYNKGKSIGRNHRLFKQAVRYADDVVVRTQASASIWDVTPIQRTTHGKFLTMFQTFVINEFDFLTSDLFKYKNPYVNMSGIGGNLGRLAIASGVINYFYEGVLKMRSPYPAPEVAYMRAIKQEKTDLQIAGMMAQEMLEIMPIVGGTFRWSTAWKTAMPAYPQTTFIDPVQMMIRLFNKPSITADQAEWIGKMAGVPGTSQGFKIWRRLKRGQTWVEAVLGVREEIKKKKRKRKIKSATKGW
jgi:hypothetical protein